MTTYLRLSFTGDVYIEGRLLPAGIDTWIHVNCAAWSSEVSDIGEGALVSVYKAISRGKRVVLMLF